MKKYVFTLLLGLILVACQAQDDRSKSRLDLAESSTDSIAGNAPKISWKVDKQYDEEGNVIGYDSVYSYAYSNMENLPKEMNLDSIMGTMKYFSRDNFYSFMKDHDMGRFMGMDSLMSRGPYFNDFFERQRNHNFSDMRRIFQQMDSLQKMMMERHRHFRPKRVEEKSKL